MTPRLITIERVALLHSVEFFQGTPSHVLAAIGSLATEIELVVGEHLIDEGTDGDCLFVIASGRLRIEQAGRPIAELTGGDVVGELAVLSPGPRNATAVVVENGLVLRVGAEVLDELLLDHPEVSRGIIDVLVRRLRPVAST